MKTFKGTRILKISILAGSILLFQFTPGFIAFPITQTPKASCRIEIDNAHISTYLEEIGRGRYLKINARSVCNVYQKSVLLTVEIYKIEFFRSRLLDSFSTNPLSAKSNGEIVEIKGAFVKCKNTKKTKYFGVAFSKALIHGEYQYAGRTRSKNILPLRCGT